MDNEAQVDAAEDALNVEDQAEALEGEIVIAIEGEEPDVDEDAEVEAEANEKLGEKGKNAVARLRQANKDKAARLRELEAKVSVLETAAKPKESDELGPEPEYSNYNFIDADFAKAMRQWTEKKIVHDAKRSQEQTAAKVTKDAYDARLAHYHAERSKVGVDDDAQSLVVAALSPPQQSALMDVGDNDRAKVVAALSKSPKILAELAGIKEIHKFTYRLAQIEGKITMTAKAPPPPESKLKGGVSVAPMNAGSLEKLRTQAENSGNYSEYFRAKAATRQAS